MDLIQPSYLGSGYRIYMDNFYTSPSLFLELASMKFGACGTYRDNTKGCPSRGEQTPSPVNRKRGAMRWIREGPRLFIKWMDTREVSMCSTIHLAFQSRVEAAKDIPCPTPVITYNKNVGGVDGSDQLIQYYSTHHKNCSLVSHPCSRTLWTLRQQMPMSRTVRSAAHSRHSA